MRIFLICPISQVTSEETEAIGAWVKGQEAEGHSVYWPTRDIFPTAGSLRTGQDNRDEMEKAEAIYIWWKPGNEDCLFYLGMVFAMYRTVFVVNVDELLETPRPIGNSYTNLLLSMN